MAHLTLRMSANRHTLTGPHGTMDLSRFFTVTKNNQGLRADRAGEYQRNVVNPVKDWLGIAAR